MPRMGTMLTDRTVRVALRKPSCETRTLGSP